jgi:hypothetical protein
MTAHLHLSRVPHMPDLRVGSWGCFSSSFALLNSVTLRPLLFVSARTLRTDA